MSTGASHASEEDAILSEPGPDLSRRLDAVLSPADLRQFVIDAEVHEFSQADQAKLRARLREFVRLHRNSNDPMDQIAVGAAIRKLVAILGPGEALQYAAELLDARSRASVPLDLEVEVVKMVVRKLSASPPPQSDSLPELSDRLIEILETYLNPRLLSRDKYAAAALNAALGLVLSRSTRADAVLGRISQLPVPWWQEQFVRRASRIALDLRRGDRYGSHAEVIRALEQVSRLAEGTRA